MPLDQPVLNFLSTLFYLCHASFGIGTSPVLS